MPIPAIILAAGSSSRMLQGQHKLLLPLGKEPVIVHVVKTAFASQARPIIVVLGHRATLVRSCITAYTDDAAIMFVENPDFAQGMSSSVRMGIQTVLHLSNPIDAALILLADQPLLTSDSIDTLIATKYTTGQRIIAPLYAGKRGNPILFDASLFPELLEITGDEGGRKVIERHRQEVAMVEIGDAIAGSDIDTWEAYQDVVKAWERKQQP